MQVESSETKKKIKSSEQTLLLAAQFYLRGIFLLIVISLVIISFIIIEAGFSNLWSCNHAGPQNHFCRNRIWTSRNGRAGTRGFSRKPSCGDVMCEKTFKRLQLPSGGSTKEELSVWPISRQVKLLQTASFSRMNHSWIWNMYCYPQPLGGCFQLCNYDIIAGDTFLL